ncbi:MAG: TPM domain-containing protein [Chthoniobacterales bacterium]
MSTREFIDALAEERIVDAVRAAEERTSGEIRVFVTRRKLCGEDVRVRARTEFERLHVGNTELQNGVLFYVVPAEQTFAVIGDEGIHAKCGQSFWDETAAAMEALFREGKFTDGVVAGVQRAGEVLARHYPRRADDRNELSDAVARD